MNTRLLSLMIAATSAMMPAMIYAQADSTTGNGTSAVDSETPYIIVADELGNLPTDDDGNYDLVPMQKVAVGDDIHYTASNVDVPSGKFAIYAKDAQGGNETFYGLVGWAVKPLVCGDAYPNPLMIVSKSSGIMELPEAGFYNFDFFDRKVIGEGYNQVAVTKVGATIYPRALYIISGSTKIEIPEIPDAPGCYYTIAALPSTFQISYEKELYDLYSFGPENASDAVLEAGVHCPIAHAANFSTKFSAGTTARSATGESDVYINLGDDNMFIQLALPGMSGLESIENTGEMEAEYYTLSGVSLGTGRPSVAGIYLKRTSAGTEKVAIR